MTPWLFAANNEKHIRDPLRTRNEAGAWGIRRKSRQQDVFANLTVMPHDFFNVSEAGFHIGSRNVRQIEIFFKFLIWTNELNCTILFFVKYKHWGQLRLLTLNCFKAKMPSGICLMYPLRSPFSERLVLPNLVNLRVHIICISRKKHVQTGLFNRPTYIFQRIWKGWVY